MASCSKGTVLVAMSGGVDSAVVAGLLVRRGWDVVGVTLQIWQESRTDPRHAGCCSLGAVEDARRTARVLGIPHYVLNFKDTFRETVIDDFVEEYARGRTPNPCVRCNRYVKFDALLERARELGCDRLATGHYARVRRQGDRLVLQRARNQAKDQSYVLYMLDQDQLARVWFPLGDLADKAETRAIAHQLGLPVADKPESMEICFVEEEGGYREFLRTRRPELFAEGELVDAEGAVVGSHAGVAAYTVGQRKGLRLHGSQSAPLYVLGVDAETNRVRVGQAEALWEREVTLGEAHWHGPPRRERVVAMIRSNMAPQPATLLPGPPARLIFDEPVRAVSPGQIAVAYKRATVVAGGTIAGA